ncbi:2-polyprenyl-6-methoxyphenol hydroxylase-like FAD-dependent oxidoreductase [Microbacterium trichothecenolyticum]|uniref:FAD-dependent monooxygenase n=1 Tax=Microbacterium trichothecenolyticum TaxID=69370 RepID=UPI002866FA70|nr:FAD-dependent monooxygenase [Microbacterium trichothecenolyticum]MDR7183828.1 2-polyprenyl-6-methoxyphenol hydroxylase-like FAD-dependent oxidoreductase [Microbacterium trichothecenolyticum]
MTAVNKVAIAGSGVSGLAAAIQLAKAGVEVDVFEAKPELSALGSGISLQGNALRVFDALGAWDDIRAAGYPFEGLNLRAPGPGAPIVAELPDVKTGGPDYPAAMGMPRPALARILLDHAQKAGANVRFGTKVTGLEQSGDAVEVFVDGASVGTYDLLVGADGLNSAVRGLIGIETKPEPTGMGIWRSFVSRPAEVVRSELYYGGPVYIAGYTPTGDDTMYAFLVEKAQDRFDISDADATRIMLEESRAYDGPWNSIRADLEGGAHANYTWFTKHIVEGSWNRGRVVLIGDAAHSCPPTIAQGAAQGLEDALVLTELLAGRDAVDAALWDEFHARRLPRAKAVVEASVQLGQWQLDGVRDADVAGLMFGVAHQMAVPA